MSIIFSPGGWARTNDLLIMIQTLFDQLSYSGKIARSIYYGFQVCFYIGTSFAIKLFIAGCNRHTASDLNR